MPWSSNATPASTAEQARTQGVLGPGVVGHRITDVRRQVLLGKPDDFRHALIIDGFSGRVPWPADERPRARAGGPPVLEDSTWLYVGHSSAWPGAHGARLTQPKTWRCNSTRVFRESSPGLIALNNYSTLADSFAWHDSVLAASGETPVIWTEARPLAQSPQLVSITGRRGQVTHTVQYQAPGAMLNCVSEGLIYSAADGKASVCARRSPASSV